MAAESSINWRGFVYTYSIEPNEKILLENGISLLALSLFRNYLATSVQVVPVPLAGYDVNNKVFMREYERLVKTGYFEGAHGIEHLGRRGKKGGFLDIKNKYSTSNIEWFRAVHPQDQWVKLVSESAKQARKLATRKFENESRLKDAMEMVNSLLSAAEASERYYKDRSNTEIDSLKDTYELIVKSIKSPKIVLESACYLWLVKDE